MKKRKKRPRPGPKQTKPAVGPAETKTLPYFRWFETLHLGAIEIVPVYHP